MPNNVPQKTNAWTLFFPLSFFVYLLLWGTSIQPVFSQANRILQVEDWTYEYIKRLQRRGLLLSLHPTALPYRIEEVTGALEHIDIDHLSSLEKGWVSLLKKELMPNQDDHGGILVGGSFELGAFVTNNDRLDPLRYTDRGESLLTADLIRFFPYAHYAFFFEKNRLFAQVGVRHDVFYRNDPDGIRAERRFLARNENSYIGYNGRWLSLYVGRYSNHWGIHGASSVLVSANPRCYDHINLRFGNARISLRSVLGELDSVTADGRFTGTAGADSVRSSERRFLSAHRFDWRPSRSISVTLMEATVYSGAGSSLSLKYLNPLLVHAFAVDNKPKNDENNGFLAAMIWSQFGKMTLQGQLMADDFEILKESGESPSLAFSGSAYFGALIPSIDLGLEFEAVSARAYNTHQSEGRYLYLRRGLATQFNDYIQTTLSADIYCDTFAPGLMMSPYLSLLRQGEQDIRNPLPGHNVGFVLDGTIERTTRLAVRFYFQNDTRWWAGLNLGMNIVENKNGIEDLSETRFVGLLQFGGRFSLTTFFNDDF